MAGGSEERGEGDRVLMTHGGAASGPGGSMVLGVGEGGGGEAQGGAGKKGGGSLSREGMLGGGGSHRACATGCRRAASCSSMCGGSLEMGGG